MQASEAEQAMASQAGRQAAAIAGPLRPSSGDSTTQVDV